MWLNSIYLLFCDDGRLVIRDCNTSWQNFTSCCKQQIKNIESITVDADSYLSSLQQVAGDKSLVKAVLYKPSLFSSFPCIYLVIPDHWVTRVTRTADLVASTNVHRLAGLALASEISHLAPDLVHYHFHTGEGQELSVEACPSSVIQSVEGVFDDGKQLKGAITASAYSSLLYQSQSFKQLSKELSRTSLSTYQQKMLNPEQRRRRWVILICLVLVTQLTLFSLQQFTLHHNLENQTLLQSARKNTVSLPSVERNLSYEVAVDALQTLPLTVRFNGFQNRAGISYLSLTGVPTTLSVLTQSWRERWLKFSFESKLTNQQQRTRSVQDVVIEIKGVETAKKN